MTGILQLHVRRSAAVVMLPVLLTALAANFLLRDQLWQHEWLLAVEQLDYATLLLGPFLGAAAAWDGVSTARRRDQLGSAARRLSPSLWPWLAYPVAIAVVYLVGLTVLLVGTAIGGAQPPGWRILISIIPAMLLLALEAAVGYCIGIYWLNYYAAPTVAIGIYVTSIYLYIRGPVAFISVGGASESLVAFEPILNQQLAQIAFYTLATMLLLVLALRLLRGHGPSAETTLMWALGLGVAVAAVWLVQYNGDRFVPATTALQCRGSSPSICVSPGYVRASERLVPIAHDVWHSLGSLGVGVPDSLNQGVQPGAVHSAPLDASTIDNPTKEMLANSVLLANVAKSCDVMATRQLANRFSLTSWWLQRAVGGIDSSPFRNSPLTGLSMRDQVRWINQSMVRFRSCQ